MIETLSQACPIFSITNNKSLYLIRWRFLMFKFGRMQSHSSRNGGTGSMQLESDLLDPEADAIKFLSLKRRR